MSENFSKSQLEQMRVADLRNIAENYSIDVSGMKKSDLVEAILDVDEEDKQSDISVEFDEPSENIQDTSIPEDAGKPETDEDIDIETDDEDCKECNLNVLDSDNENIEIPKSANSVSNESKVVIKNGIAPLYYDKNCTKVCSRISGKMIILSEFENSTKVRGFISGYGPIVGYIRK